MWGVLNIFNSKPFFQLALQSVEGRVGGDRGGKEIDTAAAQKPGWSKVQEGDGGQCEENVGQ